MLRQLIACRPVTADADADKASAAALALRLIDRMHDAFADAIQITACFAKTLNLQLAGCTGYSCSHSRRL